MKAVIFALASVALSVLATPIENDAAKQLESRGDNCFHASHCSDDWAKQGRKWCGNRGFSHMTRDGCRWWEPHQKKSGAGGGDNNLPKFNINKFGGTSSPSNNGKGMAPLQSNNKPGTGPKPNHWRLKLKVGPK
ncbi:hypothetical protein DL765_005317 [Monosporascus sp. GIB2]|nr:hypothetical protein DL765_005317 [Monosporascus sp. GIB2]